MVLIFYCKIVKGVWTIKGEFYQGNEYNSTAEYKYFPAEIYKISKEIGDSGKEEADLGAEITTLQKKSDKKTPPKSGENDLVNKIFNSIKGVATVSTVAAVAVLGATTIAAQPSVELLQFSVGGDYVEYEMSIEDLQDDLRYCIVISTSNEADREIWVEENGVYKDKADGLKPKWEYSLSFVGYDEYLGKTTYFEKKFQTSTVLPQEPELPNYQAGISAVTLSGLNEIRVDFWQLELDDACTLELLLGYGEGVEKSVVPISKQDTSRGYVCVDILENSLPVSVQPVIKYGENDEILEFENYTFDLETSLEADISVDVKNYKITYYLKGITNGATYVNVVNTQTQAEVDRQELYDDYVIVYYDSETTGVLEHTIFFTDEAGERVSDEFNVSVDVTPQEMGEYTFNYKNSGEVGVTYNDDGTINVYIQTEFETADERLYYQVTLGDMRFQSREPTFVAVGLPCESYGLTYDICYDYNGIQYSVNCISVSGTVNEFWFEPFTQATIVGNSVQLSIADYQAENVDLNSIRLVTSSGEEIQISEADFVYDEENWQYVCVVDFVTDFEFVELYETCRPFADNMQGIDEYVGSVSVEVTATVYKE